MENRLNQEQIKLMGALGYRDELTDDELKGKHIDGLTGLVFETEEQYLDHLSPVTGHTPKEGAHMGEDFIKISEGALKRGKTRKEFEGDGFNEAQAKEVVKEMQIETIR
jgi:hypothetical protein